MNPLTNVKNITKLNEIELEKGLIDKKSWHGMYKDSAWIFIGGLAYGLTEGDIIAVFSQYGEIVNINLVRDKKTGKTKGFCFLCYANQKSTILAVDNLNGIKLCNRTIRVDHVANYKPPKEDERDDEITKILKSEGCAPKQIVPQDSDVMQQKQKKKKKKLKKEKKEHSHKKKKRKKSVKRESPDLSKVKIEKQDSGYDKYDESKSLDSRQKGEAFTKHSENDSDSEREKEKRKPYVYSTSRDQNDSKKEYNEHSKKVSSSKHSRNEICEGGQKRPHSSSTFSRHENVQKHSYDKDYESRKHMKHSSVSKIVHKNESRHLKEKVEILKHKHSKSKGNDKVHNDYNEKQSCENVRSGSRINSSDASQERSHSKQQRKAKNVSSSSSSSDSDQDENSIQMSRKGKYESISKSNSSEKRTYVKDDSNASKNSYDYKKHSDESKYKNRRPYMNQEDNSSYSKSHKRPYNKYENDDKYSSRKLSRKS